MYSSVSIRFAAFRRCLAVALVIGVPWLASKATAQSLSRPTDTPLAVQDASDDLNQLITQLALESIPHTFTDDKKWGRQQERFDGLKRERDGLRIKISQRTKLVNHGTWQKYDVSLRKPNQEFAIEVNNLRELPSQSIGFDINFAAHLNVQGRQSKWVKGVQLYSLSATGHAQVRLKLSMELQVKTDAKVFPPDLVFVPIVKSADVQLDEFRIDRVGKAGGEFAQQVSRRVRPILEKKIEQKEQGLADKINRKLAKKQDRLRLSVSKAVNSKWTKAAKELLPKPVQHALQE